MAYSNTITVSHSSLLFIVFQLANIISMHYNVGELTLLLLLLLLLATMTLNQVQSFRINHQAGSHYVIVKPHHE